MAEYTRTVDVTAPRPSQAEIDQFEKDNQFVQGVKGGLTGLISAPIFLPSALAGFKSPAMADMQEKMTELFGLKGEPQRDNYVTTDNLGAETFDESKYLTDKSLYLAGEGGGSGGLFGIFKKGLASKLATIGILASENAVTNTAIGLFTNDPVSRMLYSLPAGVLVDGQKIVKKIVEKNYIAPTVDPTTGVILTNFQSTGSGVQGAKELQLRMNPEAYDKVNLFEINKDKTIDSFITNIQKFASNSNLGFDKVVNGVQAAYKNYTLSLIGKMKSDSKTQFDLAIKAGANPSIQLNNTRNTIKSFLDSADMATPNGGRVGDMKRLLAAYPDASVQFKTEFNPLTMVQENKAIPIGATGINIDKLQQQLAAWGDAASTGSYKLSDDASIGVTKGEAKMVLGALQRDLDEAIQDGMAGAKELKLARTNFKDNLTALNKFNSRSLTKYFGNDKNPTIESAMERLTKASPSEKVELLAVLDNTNPAIADTIRKETFNALYAKTYNSLPAAGQGKINVVKLLENFGKLTEKELRYLFPSNVEYNSFKTGAEVLRTASRRIDAGFDPNNVGRQDTSLLAGAVAGPQARYMSLIAWDTIKKIANISPEQQAILLFDPRGQKALAEFKVGNYKAFNLAIDGLGIVPQGMAGISSASNLAIGQSGVDRAEAARLKKLNSILGIQPVVNENAFSSEDANRLEELNKLLNMP